MRCSNKKCRQKKFKIFSFLKKFLKYPASIFILEEFICSGLNANKIKSLLENTYKTSIKVNSLQKILLYFQQIILAHKKIKYNSSLVGSFNEEVYPKMVALD